MTWDNAPGPAPPCIAGGGRRALPREVTARRDTALADLERQAGYASSGQPAEGVVVEGLGGPLPETAMPRAISPTMRPTLRRATPALSPRPPIHNSMMAMARRMSGTMLSCHQGESERRHGPTYCGVPAEAADVEAPF
jgi:hypothetical protein